MDGYLGRHRWLGMLFVVLVSAGVGLIAYNVGLSHGIAQAAAASGEGLPPYAYGWHRPWGVGFGFPLLFVLSLLLLLRGLFWGWGGPWQHRNYARWPDEPPSFDDWHRRAHEHMKETASADDPGRRG